MASSIETRKRKMQSKVIKYIDFLFHIAVFAAGFMIIGRFIPQTYYRYFDSTEYYLVKVPAAVGGKEFAPCNSVPVEINRVSLVDTEAVADINLVLVNLDSKERVYREVRNIMITKGEAVYVAKYNIPCSATPGRYIFDALVHFKVYDIDKYTHFYSEEFDVKNK